MIAICDTYFNPRLRGEATLNKQEIRLSLDGFQSTPPRGRRPAFPFFEAAVRDISIHASAREATAHFPVVPSCLQLISIHASAREATPTGYVVLSVHNISIHASAREATLIICVIRFFIIFQSTPPRGRRQCSKPGKHKIVRYFNPRLREGGDKKER